MGLWGLVTLFSTFLFENFSGESFKGIDRLSGGGSSSASCPTQANDE